MAGSSLGYSITDDWIDEDGVQCYEVRLHTSCCKGDYLIRWKSPKDMLRLDNSERPSPGMMKAINELLKTYKKKV